MKKGIGCLVGLVLMSLFFAGNLYAKIVSISAGRGYIVALKEGGTVVAWGSNYYGQCNVPEGLRDVGEISAGGSYTVALLKSGKVVIWESIYFFPWEEELNINIGDISGDGEIDISDVILCLRMAIGLDTPDDIYSADMNTDGKVDISDVILILRKAIGLE